MSTPHVYVDRYTALGPPNGCPGPCEGTGVVPVYRAQGDFRPRHQLGRGCIITNTRRENETDPIYVALWQHAEALMPSEDGWHFVPCQTCAARPVPGDRETP